MKKFVCVFALLSLLVTLTARCYLSLDVSAASIIGEPAPEAGISESVSESTHPGTEAAFTEPEETVLSGEAESAEDAAASEPAVESVIEETQEEIHAEDLPREAPVITFTETNETVYATTDVNVRTGAGIEHAWIGMLNYGESITRTGIGSNGWSRVVYGSHTAYMCSDYLTTSAPEPVADSTEGVSADEETDVREESSFILDSSEEEGRDSLIGSDAEPQPSEPEITFTDVCETVYATTTVNVRTGPDVGFDNIGTLYPGESITRTGIGSNGWSKVEHNGQTAYMHSDYLSVTRPVSGKLGTYGRLTIPSVGVDVALNACSGLSEYLDIQQGYIDAEDSAAYVTFPGADGYVIADHWHQGFDAMKNSVPYETYAYIDLGTHVQTFMCIGIGNGENHGHDVIDWDGVWLIADHIRGGLAMYTCNDETGFSVTISYWQPV